MKIEIITPKENDNKTDAVFYYGKEIARIQLANGKKLYLESRGELEIITDNGKVKGINALEWLKDNNHNDLTIDILSNDDMIVMSNWFVIVEIDLNGETISDDIVLDGNYNDALENLMEVYTDFYNKNYNK